MEETPLKTLFIAQSAVTAIADLALALFPSVTVSLLFGSSLDDPVATVVGRGTGITVFAWGIVCWEWRNVRDRHTPTRKLGAILFYDVAVIVVLLSAHLRSGSPA